MQWIGYVATIVAAYLLGSINPAIIVSKVALNIDIREYGSGNAGSTNAIRVIGAKLASLVAVGDVLKGVLAVYAGYFLIGQPGKLIAAVFVVLGHMYPVYYKFKGGKGVATTAAIMMVVDWRAGLIALAIFAVIAVPTGYVSLGSMIASISLPVSLAFFYDMNPVYIVFSAIISFMIIGKHRQNIIRLCKKTESKFSFTDNALIHRKKTQDDQTKDN